MGPVVGSVSSNHIRVLTLLPLTQHTTRAFRTNGVVSISAICTIDIPTMRTYGLPRGNLALERHSSPAMSTMPNNHFLPSGGQLRNWITPMCGCFACAQESAKPLACSFFFLPFIIRVGRVTGVFHRLSNLAFRHSLPSPFSIFLVSPIKLHSFTSYNRSRRKSNSS